MQLQVAALKMPLKLKVAARTWDDLWRRATDAANRLKHPQRKDGVSESYGLG
jgi:hypothetical protein